VLVRDVAARFGADLGWTCEQRTQPTSDVERVSGLSPEIADAVIIAAVVPLTATKPNAKLSTTFSACRATRRDGRCCATGNAKPRSADLSARRPHGLGRSPAANGLSDILAI
jgi:hypothetical protein